MTTIETLGKYLTEKGWIKNQSDKRIRYHHTHGKDVKAVISLFQDRLKIVIYEYYINVTQHKKQNTSIWLYSMTIREAFAQYLKSKGWNIHQVDEKTTCIHSNAPAVWLVLWSTKIEFDTQGSDLHGKPSTSISNSRLFRNHQ